MFLQNNLTKHDKRQWLFSYVGSHMVGIKRNLKQLLFNVHQVLRLKTKIFAIY